MGFQFINHPPSFDLGISVSKGLVEDFTAVGQFGYNTAVGTSFETVWGVGGFPVYPTTATGCAVTSSNTVADNGGTVLVTGLDADYNLAQEVLTIGGGAGSQVFRRVFRATLETATTGTANVGTVTVTVDSKSAAIISVGRGQTLMSLYTIPAGKKGYLMQLDVGNQKDLELEVALVFRNGSSNVWQTKDFITKRGGFTEKQYVLPIEINEKTDFEVRAKASATAAVSAGFELVVLDVPRTMQV